MQFSYYLLLLYLSYMQLQLFTYSFIKKKLIKIKNVFLTEWDLSFPLVRLFSSQSFSTEGGVLHAWRGKCQYVTSLLCDYSGRDVAKKNPFRKKMFVKYEAK